MEGLTRSTSTPNPAASASVVTGLAALAALPAGIGASRYSERVDLIYGCAGGVVACALLGFLAVAFARRAHRRIQLTIGRSGGAGAARTGRVLGVLAIGVAITGALALGFFGLLELFAS